MKTVYKATLLATATTLFCGLAIGQSRDVAPRVDRDARGTPPLQTLPFATPAPVAARPAFDPTATPRLPVLMLTQTYGDSAREMFAGGAVGYTLRNFPFQSTKTIVYLDVDTFNPRSRLNQEALALAKEAGWPVVIESETWDARRVSEVTAMLFPEMAPGKLSNTSVIVEAGPEGWSVRDTWPSEVAMKAGIPFEQTTEGTAMTPLKAGRAYSPVHWSVHFAKMAYSRNPGDFWYEGKRWKLGLNRDVVKSWVYFHPELGVQCILSFRGTDSADDWKTNFANQFKNTVDVPGIPAKWRGKRIEIGRGYADRLENLALDQFMQCSEMYVTGHSLGGAMAQAYALRELLQDDDAMSTPENIRGVFVYNPSRLGRIEASREFSYQLREPARFWGSRYNKPGLRQFRSYCRSKDPVWYAPAGLVHGAYAIVNNGSQCTHAGAYRSTNTLDPKKAVEYNHSIDRWFEAD